MKFTDEAEWREARRQAAVKEGCLLRGGCDPSRYTHGTDCPLYPWERVLDAGFPA